MAATHRNRLVTAISNTPGAAGALTIAAAASGYRTFGAGDDGLSFDVSIVDGTDWEIRTGCIYTQTGTSLARGTLEDSSTGSAIALTSAAVVTVTMSAGMGNSISAMEKSAIVGLQMKWVSVSAIDITMGGAYIESLGRVYTVPAAISLTGLSALTASTLCHVYLYDNAGTPAAEVVTTAPATYYFATARSKTGDSTRRYLGSVYVNASQQIAPFSHSPTSGEYLYRLSNGASPSFRVLSAGSATTKTVISCAAFVPASGVSLLLKISNTHATSSVCVGSAEDNITGTEVFITVSPTIRTVTPCPLNGSQQFAYLNNAASSNAFIDLLGYWYTR